MASYCGMLVKNGRGRCLGAVLSLLVVATSAGSGLLQAAHLTRQMPFRLQSAEHGWVVPMDNPAFAPLVTGVPASLDGRISADLAAEPSIVDEGNSPPAVAGPTKRPVTNRAPVFLDGVAGESPKTKWGAFPTCLFSTESNTLETDSSTLEMCSTTLVGRDLESQSAEQLNCNGNGGDPAFAPAPSVQTKPVLGNPLCFRVSFSTLSSGAAIACRSHAASPGLLSESANSVFGIASASAPLGFPVLLAGRSESRQTSSDGDEAPCIPPGPADEPLSYWKDLRTSPTWLYADLASLATMENAVFLSAAAGGAILLRDHVDGHVQQSVAEHGGYFGGASHWLNAAGESVVHVPLLTGLYGYSLYTQDEELHELALTFVTAYKFTAMITLPLQYATNSRHGEYGGLRMVTDSGFPSFPAASSFALASVVEEKYGWKAGLPAYLSAGLIGWAGIDQQQHRVSDVVFGAALGYAVGKSIGALHYRPDATYKLVPFTDAVTGAQGLQFEKRF